MAHLDNIRQQLYLCEMNVNLGERFTKLVRNEVESGRYNNASEVVRDALRLLEDRNERKAVTLQALRSHIELGFQQSVRGESTDGEKFFATQLGGKLDDEL